jgi:hypothetical protein
VKIRCDAAVHFTLRSLTKAGKVDEVLHSWRQCKNQAVVSLVSKRAPLCFTHFKILKGIK